MNQTREVSVHHYDGLVFNKYQADTGITYLPVEPDEVVFSDRSLLVRHGNHDSGRCGYYPLWLLYRDEETRKRIAEQQRKRPPSEFWVGKVVQILAENGINPRTH